MLFSDPRPTSDGGGSPTLREAPWFVYRLTTTEVCHLVTFSANIAIVDHSVEVSAVKNESVTFGISVSFWFTSHRRSFLFIFRTTYLKPDLHFRRERVALDVVSRRSCKR